MGLGIGLGVGQAARLDYAALQRIEGQLTAGFMEHRWQSGVFVQSVLQNGVIMLLVWLMALLPAGQWMAASVLLVKAMGYGYTGSVLIRTYGGAGFLYTLTRLGPQGLIWQLAALFLCVINFKRGGALRCQRTNAKQMTEYFLALLLTEACVVLAAFI
jgi:hypothetical protein